MADITVWVDFIPLIRAGILGINISNQGSRDFLDSHPEFRDKKFWLHSLSDAFAKIQERTKKRRKEKTEAAKNSDDSEDCVEEPQKKKAKVEAAQVASDDSEDCVQ